MLLLSASESNSAATAITSAADTASSLLVTWSHEPAVWDGRTPSSTWALGALDKRSIRSVQLLSRQSLEGAFSEVCKAPVQHPCHLGRPNATKRSNKTRLTTSYLLMLRAVAGCATGSTRPKRCPTA